MNRLILENLSIKLRQISMDLARDGGTGAEYAKDIAFADLVIFEMGSTLYPGYAPSPEPRQVAAPAAKPEKKKTSGKRAPKGQGEHRHRFNVNGICDLAVNGKMCAAKRLRAAKGSTKEATPPDAAARTVPLAVAVKPLIGDYAADDFDGGAFGSSGTGDR